MSCALTSSSRTKRVRVICLQTNMCVVPFYVLFPILLRPNLRKFMIAHGLLAPTTASLSVLHQACEAHTCTSPRSQVVFHFRWPMPSAVNSYGMTNYHHRGVDWELSRVK